MNAATEEGPDRQHHGRRKKLQPHGGFDTGDAFPLDNQVIHGLLE
jgi:hypothetical protein